MRLTNQALTSFSRPFSKIYWTLGGHISVYKQLLTLLRLSDFEPGGREFESLRARIPLLTGHVVYIDGSAVGSR